MGIGLDALCGREAQQNPPDSPADSPAGSPAAPPSAQRLPLWAWLGLCAACLVLGLLIGLLIPNSQSQGSVPALPENLQVDSWKVSWRADGFSCSYVPSLAHEGLTYKMLFIRKDFDSQVSFDLTPHNGTYAFQQPKKDMLPQGFGPGRYDVYAEISTAQQTRHILIAEDLRIDADGSIGQAEP